MTTIEMEIIVIAHHNPRINIIVPNISWGMYRAGLPSLHECDILVLSKNNYATEIEIKISRADLLKDSKKWHRHQHKLIKKLFYAIPSYLEDIALETIPDTAGLYIEHNNKLKMIRKAKARPDALKWTSDERYQLARLGTLRILDLKRKIVKERYKSVKQLIWK